MSYILDALKRADAERERGAVPGLHTRQVATPMPQSGSSRQRRLGAVLAGTLALVGLALGYWAWQSSGRDTRVAPPHQAAATPAAGASAPALEAPAVLPAPMPKAATSAVANAASAASGAQGRLAGAGAATGAILPTVVPVQTAQTGASAVRAAAVAIPLLNELPQDMRRQIPALTITGAVDSDYPAQRMLLLNGQVLKQGSVIAPDLSLEEIGAHSSVLSYRGTLFRIAY